MHVNVLESQAVTIWVGGVDKGPNALIQHGRGNGDLKLASCGHCPLVSGYQQDGVDRWVTEHREPVTCRDLP